MLTWRTGKAAGNGTAAAGGLKTGTVLAQETAGSSLIPGGIFLTVMGI